MIFQVADESLVARLPKYEQLAREIEQVIYSKRLADGHLLPPESELAEMYGVSRGTVRRALADLAERKVIATKNGVGSRVTFRNRAFDESRGWGAGLIASGVEISVETLRIERITDPLLCNRIHVEDQAFIAIDRYRTLPTGTVISLEYSRVLADYFPDLPNTGLIDGSLTETIKRSGLKGEYGQETVRVQALDAQSAEIFHRPAGARFMVTEKSVFTGNGTLVECVKSYLDPDHFEYTNTF